MGNEVEIVVTAADATGPVKDEIKASWQAFEKSFQPLGLRAANPINEAFMAEVKASIKSLSSQALEIPVDADTAPFLAQVEAQLEELANLTRADIPLEVANAQGFRSEVLEQVESISQSVKAVIQVETDDASLVSMREKILAAADASAQEVEAQQKLAQALQSGNAEGIAKAQADLATAEKSAADAAALAAEAQDAVAAAEKGVAGATDVASVSMRGLNEAMGPLWMIMNVAQMAMFAFMGTGNSTSSAAQNLTQQVIGLGNATALSSAQQLAGNDALAKINTQLVQAGSSSVAFAQASAGGAATMRQYVDQLTAAQTQLGQMTASYTTSANAANRAGEEQADTTKTVTATIAELAQQVASGAVGMGQLDQATQNQVNTWNAYKAVLPAAKQELDQLNAAQQVEQAQLAAVGYTMTDQQQATNNYGMSLQALVKDYADATAGAKYLEDSQDQASITAGQAVQHWQQLDQAVTSAQAAYRQAAEGVASAEHSVETASQGVASAIHSEQQAVLATANAQHSYVESLYQEQQAQLAVQQARAAAEQQLISLQLQANDAAASAESANLSLFNAQQAAAALGVNPGNAQQIAGEQITAINEKQVAAAIALIQAENQVADSQNSSSQAQSSLNTARQQGVDNNPAVLSAEHALEQAHYAVGQAADGVTNAEYAQQQAALQVSNAEWSLHSASVAVTQAQDAEYQASVALTTARDNDRRSTDQNTAAGAQNRQMLEQIFDAEQKATGSEQIAAAITQQFGQQLGFTSGQIGDVIGKLNGINGMNVQFGITGTPSLNPQQLTQVGQELGMNFAQIEAVLPTQNVGRARAAGGPGGGLTWVGEDGPELVALANGAEVIPHANSMQHAARGLVDIPGHAAGGPVSAATALGENLPVAAQWGAYDVVGQMVHALGGPPITLPPAGSVDMGAFGFAASGGASSRAATSGVAAAAQAYAASLLGRYGWGPDQMPPLIALWNQESGWNPWAVNPSSGAYGIPQSLGHGHPYDLGDYMGQIDWGLDYIAGRYGSPASAEAHEQAVHWYAGGGPVGADGWIGVGDDGPELLRVQAGSSVRPAANRGTAVADGAVHVDVEIHFTGATDSGFATYFQRQVRENKIQLNVNGQRVKAGG